MDVRHRPFDPPTPPEQVVQRLTKPFCTFIASTDGKIAGLLVAKTQPAMLPDGKVGIEGVVCDIYVKPAHRRRGIATALYATASKWFSQTGCCGQRMTCYIGNPARSLYARWRGPTSSICPLPSGSACRYHPAP
jgi:ribosomal protein S18 acetylase RimI-like enzyme